MDCKEFRRQTQVDPLARSTERLAHEDECSDCASYARAARAREIRLRALLHEVAPPVGLDDRIRHAARTEQQQGWRYAAAFGLLLLIGASMLLVQRSPIGPDRPALVNAVLAHIAAEQHHLRQDGEVSSSRLEGLFQRFGARLAGTLHQVSFAGECLMREHTGVHLVLRGNTGPVTVFFMPGEDTDRELPIAFRDLAGSILPTGWGSIALVGRQGEDIASIKDRISAAVDWPAST